METIQRIVNGELEVFSIYPKEEADRRGFKYVHWKEAHAGDLALSDDGYVGVCLARSEYNRDKANALINICYGKSWRNSKKLLFIERRESGVFSQSTCKTWGQLEVRRERAKRFVRAYVDMFMQYSKIDWKRLGEIYRPDLGKPEKYAKKLFNNPEVNKMIRVEVQKVLDERGINEGSVIDLFNDAVAIAKKNSQPTPIIRVAENYSEMLQMKGGNLPLTNPFAGLSIIDGVYGELENETQKQLTNGKPAAKSGKSEPAKESADGE